MPVSVSSLTDAVQVSAGYKHTCARRRTGAVVCWGNNQEGAIGNGSTNNPIPTPTAASGLSDAVYFSAATDRSYAVRADGSVVYWGLSLTNGQPPVLAPTPIANVAGGVEVSGDVDLCVRRTGGEVLCGGYVSRRPGGLMPVPGLNNIARVDVGSNFICALTNTGTVLCWGNDNAQGVLGDGTTTAHLEPAPVVGLTDAVDLSAGKRHACAVTRSGAIYCWGSNVSGNLGDGTTSTRLVPTLVAGS
jgi:alpha-tubulin suppressor-like RCC1 family protein